MYLCQVLVFALVFSLSSSLFAVELSRNSDSYGYFASFCNHTENRSFDYGKSSAPLYAEIPDHVERRCTMTFVSGVQSGKHEREYKLSFYDPVEVFYYKSKDFIKIDNNNSYYWLMPVLGHIRDRYVESSAFGYSLLFTTEITGVGFAHRTDWVRVMMDANLIHFYQRYGGVFVGDTEHFDPEREQIFAFSQVAMALRANIEFNFMREIRAKLRAQHIRVQEEQYPRRDQEFEFILDFPVFQNSGTSFGLKTSYYHRFSNVRHDREKGLLYQLTRWGLYVLF